MEGLLIIEISELSHLTLTLSCQT
ncbi:hypothetical protein [Peribacillus simplex]